MYCRVWQSRNPRITVKVCLRLEPARPEISQRPLRSGLDRMVSRWCWRSPSQVLIEFERNRPSTRLRMIRTPGRRGSAIRPSSRSGWPFAITSMVDNYESGVKSADCGGCLICVSRKAEFQHVVPHAEVIDKFVVGCDHQHVCCLSGRPPVIRAILARSRAEALLLSNLAPEAGSDSEAPCGSDLVYHAFPALIPDRTRSIEVFPTAQGSAVARKRLRPKQVSAKGRLKINFTDSAQ
jgi:hypothetical protein